jgi:phosphatidylglycerol---prolipoprotein diacylglyceryl transferase
MLPVMQIGPFVVQTYLLAVLLATWAGLAMAAWVASRSGLEGDHIYNVGLSGLLGGLVIGRLAHVIAFWPAYRMQPLDILGLNSRAFLLGPATLGGLVIAAWYVQRHRLRWPAVLDAALSGALLAVVVVDAGAFLAGQAVGAPAHIPWAVTLWGVSRHPSQVYEALAAGVTLGVMLALLRRGTYPGTAAWVGVLGYGLSRWLLEPFRADSATVLGGLRVAQLLGLGAALIALWALRRLTPYPEIRQASGASGR